MGFAFGAERNPGRKGSCGFHVSQQTIRYNYEKFLRPTAKGAARWLTGHEALEVDKKLFPFRIRHLLPFLDIRQQIFLLAPTTLPTPALGQLN